MSENHNPAAKEIKHFQEITTLAHRIPDRAISDQLVNFSIGIEKLEDRKKVIKKF